MKTHCFPVRRFSIAGLEIVPLEGPIAQDLHIVAPEELRPTSKSTRYGEAGPDDEAHHRITYAISRSDSVKPSDDLLLAFWRTLLRAVRAAASHDQIAERRRGRVGSIKTETKNAGKGDAGFLSQ